MTRILMTSLAPKQYTEGGQTAVTMATPSVCRLTALPNHQNVMGERERRMELCNIERKF